MFNIEPTIQPTQPEETSSSTVATTTTNSTKTHHTPAGAFNILASHTAGPNEM